SDNRYLRLACHNKLIIGQSTTYRVAHRVIAPGLPSSLFSERNQGWIPISNLCDTCAPASIAIWSPPYRIKLWQIQVEVKIDLHSLTWEKLWRQVDMQHGCAPTN